MSLGDTIAAVATAPGRGGVAVVRVSGPEAFQVAERIAGRAPRAGRISFDRYRLDGRLLDDGVTLAFKAPHSYTGEEMVEISSHGSGAVKQEILKCLGMSGIRMAYPGEFSRRAFINGKMSLASAEAVMDVINSETERQLEAAGSLLSGKLADEIAYIENNLYEQAAMLETFTEFDTEDDEAAENAKLETVKDNLSDCHDRLTSLCKGYGKGRILSERLRVALLGLPNSGKSTLLNTLTGFDRAIVTEVAGTTRDTIEVQININGIPVTLIDTAGIRETEDIIENIGIGKAFEAGRGADMVFYMIPPDMTVEEAYTGVREIAEDCESVTGVFSKSDAGDNPDRKEIEEKLATLGIKNFISISAEEDLNIDKLEDAIIDYYDELGGGASEGLLITNSRHYTKFLKATKKLTLALDALDNNLGTEVCASALRACLDEIGEVTGKTVSATLADTIFSRFCIGK